VAVSRNASLFHAVDQMAKWSEFCHAQYARWVPRGAEALLERQRALRKKHDWGKGLEQIFLSGGDSLDDAVARAPAEMRDDAREEASILEAMRPKLPGLTGAGDDARAALLRDELEREHAAFERLGRRWLAILAVDPPSAPIPLVFVKSP